MVIDLFFYCVSLLRSGDGPTKVLGYEVYLNGELEATVEGGDACSAPLVELVDGKAYTITVK